MKKKAILTIISLLLATSASAGRYHYRSYHYYGTPDDGGKYLFLIIVGILLLLGLIGIMLDGASDASKNLKEANKAPIKIEKKGNRSILWLILSYLSVTTLFVIFLYLISK
jgi:hypothetical protein